MASDQLFEIEKEYDRRYEGLDFDDVDEHYLHIRESQEEDTGHPQSNSDPPPAPLSQKTELDIDGAMETLQRAEALDRQLHAQKQPKNRILDRLEGSNSNNGSTTAGRGNGIAAPLASSQLKLTDALSANSDLASSIKNPFAFVAALTLELIPQGTSKSTVLSKLAKLLSKLKTATSEKQLLTSLKLRESTNLKTETDDKNASKRLPLQIRRTLELAEGCKEAKEATTSLTPQLEEETIRALLKLAIAPVTGNLLSQCDQAGKKMRKLRNHPVQAVAHASEAVVKAWKHTLTSS
ncbi:hypothetical protein Ndes2526B_g06389 [Nannochloris sp. 'desiccata']